MHRLNRGAAVRGHAGLSLIIWSLCFLQLDLHGTFCLSNLSICKMAHSGCLFLGHLWPPAGLTHKQIEGSLSAFLGECWLQQHTEEEG